MDFYSLLSFFIYPPTKSRRYPQRQIDMFFRRISKTLKAQYEIGNFAHSLLVHKVEVDQMLPITLSLPSGSSDSPTHKTRALRACLIMRVPQIQFEMPLVNGAK